jgi:hypothetical protein
MQITNNSQTSSIQGNYSVESKPLTDSEAKAKAQAVQDQNLQAIEGGLKQNSAGWGDKVKIKVPADSSGRAIYKPTAQDWENAAKNNQFAVVEDSPARLASEYYGVELVDFGNASENLTANSALLKELRDASSSGIIFPSNQPIPTSEIGDIVRASKARQAALKEIESGIGSYSRRGKMPPKEKVEVKVPADANGNPIKNPTASDWINAQKSNKWAITSGKSDDLAKDYFGVKIDTTKWEDSLTNNISELKKASQNGNDHFASQIRLANGDRYIDIPDAGKIIAEVLAVLGPAYNTELKKANELREQMDSLKKKNDALQKLEDSISGNDTSGRNPVDFDVPTKRYELDANGNRISTGTTDADGKTIYKTTDVSSPPTNDDWANATEFKSIKELNGGNDINGRVAAEKYFDFKLSSLEEGKDAHTTNLSLNIQKIGNVRSAVQSETSKLSGQFDFRMGNAQTNLQNANKTIASINDMMMSIARGI